MRISPVLVVIAALAATAWAASDAEDEEAGRPAPTEAGMDEETEREGQAARARWLQQMHRAPPGVDPAAVERRNGLAQVERRVRLRSAPPAEATARWVERGSDNQAGRMHAGHLNAAGDTLYGGTSNGGVWRSSPDGSDWEPIGDNLYSGAHWLEVIDDGSGGDILLVATDGGLIHRSVDGGATWETPDGPGSPTWVRRLLQLQDGSGTIFLLSADSAGVQLRRSTDLGATFEVVADLAGYYGDVWAPRDGGTTLYMMTSGGVLARSDDLGDSWTALATVDGDSGSAELTGSEAGAPRLWAVTSSAHIYRSDDAGLSWTFKGDVLDYYGTLNASHLDEDLVYVGGSGYGVPAVYRSQDGGATFEPWGDGLPDTLVYSLCEAPDDSGRVYAGTETSAYERGPDDAAWVDITDNDAPITIYWSCEALTAEDTIRFGTYGRGIWDYQLDPDHTGCYPVQDYDGDGVDCDADCDDHDATVSPLAADSCDGIDQNCDSADLDEQDADGDGYLACAECDDTRASIFPEATEVCGDGLDQDCSGADLPCAHEEPAETGEGEAETGEARTKEGGCGCGSTGSGGPGLAGLALALGAALLRRRSDP